MKNTVFIIGNGESRMDFDLTSLKEAGKIYGCNALYRDFSPDILVAGDVDITVEVVKSGYCKNNNCVFSDWNPIPAEAYSLLQNDLSNPIQIVGSEEKTKFSVMGKEETQYVIWTDNEKIESFLNNIRCLDSGGVALLLASQEENIEDIYLIGFDIQETNEGKINNIYKNSNCYLSEDSVSSNTKIVQWTKQIQNIVESYSDIKYHRVHDSKINPSEWKNLNNLDCISYHELESLLNEAILRT